MSSILTNNGAMIALQTLKGINSAMAKTQSDISTGKSVANAKDNAATWAISKVMESDVAGFKAISDSLSLGESTVATARKANETVSSLLEGIKTKITSAQEANRDRGKIQTELSALRDQITSIVGAAQFNGLNLINGTAVSPVKVMASLDRDSNGNVLARTIDVQAQDLSQTGQTVGTLATDQTLVATAAANGGSAAVIQLSGNVQKGDSFGTAATTLGLTAAVSYVARDGDTLTDVNKELVARLNVQAATEEKALSFKLNSQGQIEVTNNTATGITSAANNAQRSAAAVHDGVAGGGLTLLKDIDVSTEKGAKAALASIERLIQNSIDSASSFGAVEQRITIQNSFVGKLTDSMKSGIGSLVDADMEETSARLQALQVQQQLGVQSLSMANQAPQSILSLFR